jgi:hypothetical protein
LKEKRTEKKSKEMQRCEKRKKERRRAFIDHLLQSPAMASPISCAAVPPALQPKPP